MAGPPDGAQADSLAVESGVMLGMVAAAGSISALVRLWQLRRDPRPWSQRTAAVAMVAIQSGVVVGLVGLAATHGRHALLEWAHEDGASWVHAAASMGGWADETVAEIFSGVGGFAGATLVMRGAGVVRGLAQGQGWGGATQGVGRDLVRGGCEQLTWMVVDLVIDAVVPIPDPIVGPTVTALRVGWKLGRAAYGQYQASQGRSRLLEIRFSTLYTLAAGSGAVRT